MSILNGPAVDVKHSLDGEWWLPNGDHRTTGRCNYERTSCQLQLRGTLVEGDSEFAVHDFLYGNASLDESPDADVTALGVFQEQSGDAFVDALLVGRHLATPYADIFESCEFEFPALNAWMGHEIFEHESDLHGCGVSININQKPRVGGSWGEGEIESLQYGGQRGAGWAVREVWYQYSIKFRSNEPRSISWFERKVEQLCQLFSIFIGDLVHARRVRLFYHEKQHVWYLRPETPRAAKADPAPPRHHYRMFLSRLDFAAHMTSSNGDTDLSDIFSRWLGFTEEYRDTVTSFFGTQKTSMVAEVTFFVLSAVLDSLVTGLYGQSKSYADKILTFIGELDDDLRALVLGSEEADSLVRQRLVIQRNFGAHLRTNARRLHIEEVVHYMGHVKALIYMIILTRHLELSRDLIVGRAGMFQSYWAPEHRPIIARADHRLNTP